MKYSRASAIAVMMAISSLSNNSKGKIIDKLVRFDVLEKINAEWNHRRFDAPIVAVVVTQTITSQYLFLY